MKIIKVAEDTQKRMKKWYEDRTNAHIKKVQKYCKKVADKFDFPELIERGEIHDKSKWENPELDPYVFITWQYKCKDEGWDFEECNPPEDIEEKMEEATMHHITSEYNRHHPECHSESISLNKENRDDIPDTMVDATKMKDLDIAEMCADWMSMSEEKGGKPQGWAKKNVNVRWKFTDEQEELIYEILDEVWE